MMFPCHISAVFVACFSFFLAYLSLIASPVAAQQAPIRINCGSTSFTDSSGKVWSADNSFAGGGTYSTNTPLPNTPNSLLYQSERYGSTFSYTIPISNGSYSVNLHFAEIYFSAAGQRIFDIAVQGQQVISNLDIFASVGRNVPLVRTVPATVTNGVLSIQLSRDIENAKISAIEILSTSSGANQAPTVNAGADQTITLPATASLAGTATDDGLPNPPASMSYQWSKVSGPGTVTFSNPSSLSTSATFSQAGTYVLQLSASDSLATGNDNLSVVVNPAPSGQEAVRINCGGSSYTDSAANVWASDRNFTAGSTFSSGTPLPNTANTILYQSERYGTAFSYAVPLQNGSYSVHLHFAEIYFNAAGQRVFDVSVQGQQVVSNLDIFATVGKNVPLVRSTTATVANGVLSIQLSGDIENAKISAIEILPLGGAQNQAPVANAGSDQTITLPASANLTGSATDDGQPNPPGSLSYQWSKVNGPGTVSFGSSTSASTTVNFSLAGTYVLQLSVSDSAQSGSDSLTVVVNPVNPQNQQPTANAGVDQAITLPASANLSGSANDDGLPNPPAALSYQWSKVSGPGSVTFSSANSLTSSASFSAAGTYVLQLLASDSALSGTDSITVIVSSAPAGQAAVRINCGGGPYTDPAGKVWAGDAYFSGGGTYSSGTALPNTPSSTMYQTERFGSPFSYTIPIQNGTYTLNLHFAEIYFSAAGQRVFDVNVQGQQVISNLDIFATVGKNVPLVRSFTVSVTNGLLNIQFSPDVQNAKISAIEILSLASGNQPPVTNAGADQTVTLPANANLNGSATDDGLPNPPAALTYQWSTISGPGTVTFGAQASAATSASFSAAGNYVLQLTASDSGLSSSDTVAITVNSPNPQNQAPLANAGSDQTIRLPGAASLSGSASDDGLPNPPAELTYQWSKISGPGTVTFANPSTTATSASFSSSGTYVLQLSASDSVLTGSDSITVIVNPAGASQSAVRVNAGGSTYSDSFGRVWSADSGFSGGGAFARNSAIAGTADATLYQSEHYGSSFSYAIPVENGSYDVKLHFAEIFFTAPGQRVFNVSLEGLPILTDFDIVAEAGANTALIESFHAEVSDGVLNLAFFGQIENAKISAIEVIPSEHEGDPFLHVVMDIPSPIVDYENAGSVVVNLDGSSSHTHEIGRHLATWVWSEGGTQFASGEEVASSFAIGSHAITLEIGDDNSPPRHLQKTQSFEVSPISAVRGPYVRYFPTGGASIGGLIDNLPATAGFEEARSNLKVERIANKIGGSPFSTNVVLVYSFGLQIASAGSYEIVLSPSMLNRVFVDGIPRTGAVSLSAGTHALEVRVGIDNSSILPSEILLRANGGAPHAIAATSVSHDETNLKPFINLMPSGGSAAGSENIVISGIGFFPSSSVVVHWGQSTISGAALTVEPNQLSFISPPGAGTIDVTVQTPNGTSNAKTYLYSSDSAVGFTTSTVAQQSSPTALAWGPDGRLYVGGLDGVISAYSFADDYSVTAIEQIATIADLEANMILGLAFNPADPPSPIKLYVSHNKLFQNGGGCFTGRSDYLGQLSRLQGPDFSIVHPLLRGMPVSNHDHGVDGMVFDDQGDLLVAVGSNTNAGIADCNLGNIPESPLSAAVVKAEITKPGFNGQVSYVETSTGNSNDDQVFGGSVDIAPGTDVSVYIPGVRNNFSMVWTSRARLYSPDNGANSDFGEASTSATTQATFSSQPDKLMFLVQDNYYGSPNRNRGRTDSRQNVFRSVTDVSVPGNFNSSALALFQPSVNGIEEYRAMSFGGQLRGHLVLQLWNGELYNVQLSADGRSAQSVSVIPGGPTGLNIAAAPGGVIFAADYTSNLVTISRPNGEGGAMTRALDFFPPRARSDHQSPFIIGGSGFAGTTTVAIGGVNATLTSVSATRIRGTLPVPPSPSAALLDVVVQSNGMTGVIPAAFRYLLPAGVGKGIWESEASLPSPLGEVAGGIINGVLYLVGDLSSSTFAYDIASGVWRNNLAARPFSADHHCAEVVNGKLFLFGGLGGAEGKVQIYDPMNNSWSLGANIPIASASAATALIGGKVYYAGGIASGSTVNSAAVYDVATNTWAAIAPMPQGRNHAAAGTDGSSFFIFGGRGPGSGGSNSVAEGFDDVQIYHPATNTWESSANASSGIPPLPQKRGGMGKAAFYGAEFYVIGGETVPSGTGQVAGNVYNRVDVYNPVAKTWRLEAPLPSARHGIFPLVHAGRIYVAAGGVEAANSQSGILEVFRR